MIMNGNFTQIGVAFGSSDTMNPITANGNKQYPTALIDWNNDLCLVSYIPLISQKTTIDTYQECADPEHDKYIDEVIITILSPFAKQGQRKSEEQAD